jgi:DNA-binding NarL/FixJ family response regulator
VPGAACPAHRFGYCQGQPEIPAGFNARSTSARDPETMTLERAATAPRILIVDDSHHFLDAASGVLVQGGLTVVGTASTIAEALRLAQELDPDGILVDVDLGAENGFELTQRLAEIGSARVVLISTHAESELTELIAASPAVGFVAKSEFSASVISKLIGDQRDPL